MDYLIRILCTRIIELIEKNNIKRIYQRGGRGSIIATCCGYVDCSHLRSIVLTNNPNRIDKDSVYELYLMLELGSTFGIESEEIVMHDKKNEISLITRCNGKYYGVIWRPSENLGWIITFLSKGKNIKNNNILLQVLKRDYGLSDCEIDILSEIISRSRFHDNPDIAVVGVEGGFSSRDEIKKPLRNSIVLVEAKTSVETSTCIDVIDQVIGYALLSKPYGAKVVLALAEGFPCRTRLENRLMQLVKCTDLRDRIVVIENLRPDNDNAVTKYKNLIRKILCT